jgi:hypothetical protein
VQKIISLFLRNYAGERLVRNEVVPGAEWVLAGEGVATRKWDGTATLIAGGQFFKRYDAKHGKTPPLAFVPAQPDPDPVTGHWPGWLPVGDGPEDKAHREAWTANPNRPDGSYELVGPKVQGNPERLQVHTLLRHGVTELADAPRDFAALRAYLAEADIEGIVWHHPDGRMVKIKTKDFGLKRGAVKAGQS